MADTFRCMFTYPNTRHVLSPMHTILLVTVHNEVLSASGFTFLSVCKPLFSRFNACLFKQNQYFNIDQRIKSNMAAESNLGNISVARRRLIGYISVTFR